MTVCIEAFCGAGGMALGLEWAGFDVRFSFDNDAPAMETYGQNMRTPHDVLDIRSVTGQSLLDLAECERGQLALLSGGPPCQGFSKQRRGAHLLADPRNRLISDYIELINYIEPKSFILENVAVFGQKRGAAHLSELSEALLGHYFLYPGFFNSADFGVAQTRQRFILVGIRRDFGDTFVSPVPTHIVWPTVRDAIGDLPEPPADYRDHPDFPNHQRARVTDKNIERFSHVPPGGGWQDIPWDLRLACHKVANPKKGGWPDVYGRLRWDGQCPTITAGFDSFTRGRYGHPEENRPLTPREAARLQGFPDDFVFVGNRQEVRKQIGNAVPPPLARAIGESIAAVIDDEQGADGDLGRGVLDRNGQARLAV